MSQSNSEIKYLSIAEFSSIFAIEKSSNPYAWTERSLLDTVENNAGLGLYIKNNLIAFVLFSYVLDEAEILHIVCNKNYQGKGLAKKLLFSLIENLESKKIKTLFLEVRASNQPAINLYKNFNFEEIGLRKNYYNLIGNNDNKREDAVLMKIGLNS